MSNKTILVNRVVVTPNTILKPQKEPFALRVCLNNPNDRMKVNGFDMAKPIIGLDGLPYNHPGFGLCFEYDYSSAITKTVFEKLAWSVSLFYTDNPHIVAVEGPGIGQWGEGTRYLYNEYRNADECIAPWDDQRFYMDCLAQAFPDIPLMCRYLVEPLHDRGSVGIGLDVTPNTYDDVFLDTHSRTLQNQIVEYSCEDAFHGAEVSSSLQAFYLKDPQRFIDDYKRMNRKLAYMVRFHVKPTNKAERDNLQQIYDFVTGVGK